MKAFSMTLGSSLLLLSLLDSAQALVQFDRLFSNNMVLPHGKSVPVWGKAKPNAKLELEFGGKKYSTTSKADGSWELQLPAQAVNANPQQLSANDGDGAVQLANVRVGEVWLLSGQSNMAWKVKQSAHRGEAKAANNSGVSMLYFDITAGTGGKAYSAKEAENVTVEKMFKGSWQNAVGGVVGDFSAVGWKFAESLHAKYAGKIPVGVVVCAVGGSPIEAWIPQRVLDSKPEYKGLTAANWVENGWLSAWCRGRAKLNMGSVTTNHPFKPGFLYAAGTEQFRQYPFSGVVWYQGETNAESKDQGRNLMMIKDMVQSWREQFKQAEMPFVMVQLPRINAPKDPLRKYWPEFRQTQRQAAEQMAGVYCVNTIDLGSTDSNVHPPDKKVVGERIASLVASLKTAGKDAAKVWSTPRVAKVSFNSNQAVVKVAYAQSLKSADGKELRHFELAGADRQFYPATATIKGNEIIVSSTQVAAPQALRYAWASFVEPNVVNEQNLPLEPFRSDNWIGLNAKTKVACVGDSITFGMGVKGKNYPTILGELLGEEFEVKNFGNSGKTMHQYPSQKGRWYGDTPQHKEAVAYAAVIYISNLGINDTSKWWPERIVRYPELIKAWRGNNGAYLFAWGKLGPDYRGPKGTKAFPGNVFDSGKYALGDNGTSKNRPEAEQHVFDAAYPFEVRLFDAYTDLSYRPEWYGDGLHPNANGARRIAEITFAEMARAFGFAKAELKIGQRGKDQRGEWLELQHDGKQALLAEGYELLAASGKLVLPRGTVVAVGSALRVYVGESEQVLADNTLQLKGKLKPSEITKLQASR